MSRSVVARLRALPAVVWAVGIAVPLVFLVFISLRSRPEFAADPLGVPTDARFENYATAWEIGRLGTAFVNNIIVTGAAVVIVVAVASMAAYAITRWRGTIGRGAYVFFALGLIVPFQLGLPSLYRLWAQLGLADTLAGVVIVHVGASLPLAVFLYSGFLNTVPRDLEEAATIDGAGDGRIFVSVVFPLLKPVTATVVILTAIGVWNDLLISLFFLQSTDRVTLARAIVSFSSTFNSNIPVVFAAAVIAVAPIIAVFFALQRYFLSGITAGALRG